MSTDNEVQPINWALALNDVMYIICTYMNLGDLENLSKVCRAWRETAIKEINKRTSIQQLYLPLEMDDLNRRLYVYPRASLLVYDSKLEKSLLPLCLPDIYRNKRILAKEMLVKFKQQLAPNNLIVLGVDEHVSTLFTEHLQLHPDAPAKGDYGDSSDIPNILGVFFPSTDQRIRVRVASHWHLPWTNDHHNRTEAISYLVQELGLEDLHDPHANSAIIQIGLIGGRDHTLIGDLVKIAQDNGKEITWSSIFGAKLIGDHICTDMGRPILTSAAFIRISGPGLESWSTFIHLCSERYQIQNKLDELKAKVKPKRNNYGFIYAPTCGAEFCSHADHPCGDSMEMVVNLNRTFSNIRFTGFFVNSNVFENMQSERRRRIFADRFDENDILNKEFLHKLPYYASVIIISYD